MTWSSARVATRVAVLAGVMLCGWGSFCDNDTTPSSSPTSSDDALHGSAMLQQPRSPEICLNITTGNEHNNDGTLKVQINLNGVLSETINDKFKKEQEVVSQCYTTNVTITVSNPTSNAWAGRVMFTSGNGTLMETRCTNCGNGTGTVGKLVVDGNGDAGKQGSLTCFKKKECTLTAIPIIYNDYGPSLCRDSTDEYPPHLVFGNVDSERKCQAKCSGMSSCGGHSYFLEKKWCLIYESTDLSYSKLGQNGWEAARCVVKQ